MGDRSLFAYIRFILAAKCGNIPLQYIRAYKNQSVVGIGYKRLLNKLILICFLVLGLQ